MMIIEACPKCGHDLLNIQIATMPPINRKECNSCGWKQESTPEPIVRIPSDEARYLVDDIAHYQDEKSLLLKNFNISITDDDGKMRSLDAIIDDLANAWNKMGLP